MFIGAGNRAQDSAIIKPMSSPLLNRMVHVHLKVCHRRTAFDWAKIVIVDLGLMKYIETFDQNGLLGVEPPKHETINMSALELFCSSD